MTTEDNYAGERSTGGDSTFRTPLVSNIEIALSPAKEMFTIIPNEHGNPDTAELSTYDITLELKSTPTTQTERDALTNKLERALDASERYEPFERHSISYMSMVNQNHQVTVDWNKDSPKMKVHGSFTLNMLNGLYEMGLLDSTLQTAHQYQAAARTERRSPLMSPIADQFDNYYTIPKSTEEYTRDNISRNSGLAVGDVSTLEAYERYDGLRKDLRESVGLGALSMDDAMRNLTKIAALTLDGALPSPYPSGRVALAHAYAEEIGNDSTELSIPDERQSAALMKKIFLERLKQVTQDFIGPDQHLVMPKPGIVEAAQPGQSQPVTPDKLVQQLEDEWIVLSKEIELHNRQKELAVLHGHANTTGTGRPITADDVNLVERTLERRVKERKESEVAALVPYTQLIPLSNSDDTTYFGVTHKGIGTDKWGNEVDYQSRNPLFDKPRPIPAGLQRILDEEVRDRNNAPVRARLGDGMRRV